MDTRHLHCFTAVADSLNFTKAARQLFLTPSAVSYQIASLERELGVKLFERVPNAVRMTPAGKFFRTGLPGVMNAIDELVVGTQRMGSGASGALAIGFLGGVEKRFLPPIVERFRATFPTVAVQMARFDMIPLARALGEGKVDIAFTLSDGLPESSSYEIRLLFKVRVVAIMRPDHPLASRASLVLEDFKGVPCIDLARPPGEPVREPFVTNCARHGFRPRIVERFSDLDSVFLAVESGVGVAIFPEYRAEPLVGERVTYVPLVGDGSEANCVVAWRPDSLNPALADFVKELEITMGPLEPYESSR